MENKEKQQNQQQREIPKTGKVTEGQRQHFNHESEALKDSEQWGKTEELMPDALGEESENASDYQKSQQEKDKRQNDGMEQQDEQ